MKIDFPELIGWLCEQLDEQERIVRPAMPGVAVVVDVVFPLWRPDLMTGTSDAVEFWTQPEAVVSAERAIRAADAVTTSFPTWGPQEGQSGEPYLTWLDDLGRLNDSVHVLPSIDDDRLVLMESRGGRRVGFGEQLELIWSGCLQRKRVTAGGAS